MKDKVNVCLEELGFIPRELGDDILAFEYEGSDYVFKNCEEDKEFFRMMLPYVYEVEDEGERPLLLDIVNDVNTQLKYVKMVLAGNQVLGVVEARCSEHTDLMELVETSIEVLGLSKIIFGRMLSGTDC